MKTQPTPSSNDRHDRLDADVRTVVGIVVTGALITVLDITVVSVALKTMAAEFGSPLGTIQWAVSGYVLAMVAVIPITGWVVDRYGGRRAWMLAVSLFVAGSALTGLAWSSETLIAFRVLQGLGGGMVAPIGMTLVAQTAGPHRMGRAMSMVGIPMMLGPVLGPALGGILVSSLSWRWIFGVNVPIGVLTLWWSYRSLRSGPGRNDEPLDILGLVLLSPAAVSLAYGVSGVLDGISMTTVVLPVVLGTALLVGFVVHAERTAQPLLDLAPLANRTFAAAAALQLLMGAVLIGSMLLLPLYYQLARGESAWATGILLMPQGLGAALALWLTGRLVDRAHGGVVVLVGVALTTVGLAGFTRAGDVPAGWFNAASLLVIGLGTGCLIAPVSAAAYSAIEAASIPRATALLNVTQRLGGALGTAAFAVLLQHELANTDTTERTIAAAQAFGQTFWLPVLVSAAMALPALVLAAPSARARMQAGSANSLPGKLTEPTSGPEVDQHEQENLT